MEESGRTQPLWLRLVAHLGLVLFSAVFCVPFLWLVSRSLMTNDQIMQEPHSLMDLIPAPVRLANYPDALAFKGFHFTTYLTNTLIICALTVLGTILSCSLVAYGLSRIHWRGRNVMFYILLGTMMLPEIITLIPMFIEFKWLGWTQPGNVLGFYPRNFLPLTVPYWLALAPLYVFLMRQFFKGIPIELEEAALVDGASRLRILFNIVLPLSKPVIATVAVFAFLQSYNDFLQPLIYLNSRSNWTLALGLRALNDVQVTGQWELLFAASTAVLIPILIVFIVAQRYFVQGIATTGFGGR